MAASQQTSGPLRRQWRRRLETTAFGLMGTLLFFNPLPHTTSIKEIAFYGGSALMLAALALNVGPMRRSSPLTLPLAAFSVWALAGLATALDRSNTLHDLLAHWARYLWLYAMISHLLTDGRRFVALTGVLIASAVVLAVGAALFFYGIQGNPLSTRFALGLLPELPTNLIGTVTVTGMVLTLGHLETHMGVTRRSALLALLGVLVLVTLLTQARGTLLALPVAAGIALMHRRKLLLALLLALAVLVLATPARNRFLPADRLESVAHNIRIGIHLVSLEVVKDYPVAGIGFGMKTYRRTIDWQHYNQRIAQRYRFSESDQRIHRHTIFDPHSMPMSLAVRTGLVGLGLFGWVLAAFFRTAWPRSDRPQDDFVNRWGRCLCAAMAGFLVIGLFEPVFSHVPETVMFTLFAMAAALQRLQADGPETHR